MNKVMTRTRRQPGGRPPGRQDSRRPGSTPAPPRTPGTGTPARRPDGTPPRDPSPSAAPPTARTTSAAAAALRGPSPAQAAVRAPEGPETGPSAVRGRVTAPAAEGAPEAVTTRGRGPEAARGGDRLPPPGPRPTDVFAERLLAVLSGARPVHCMLRHTAGRAYDELVRLAERGPLRTRGPRPVVRDIGYYVARPGAVEAFARIGAGDQLRAMAFRLEQGTDLRWRCTAVEMGGPRTLHQDDD